MVSPPEPMPGGEPVPEPTPGPDPTPPPGPDPTPGPTPEPAPRPESDVVSPPEPMPDTDPDAEPGTEPEPEPSPRGAGVGVLSPSSDPEHDPERRAELARDAAHDRFGGLNPGAAFFGWLVALSSTLLVSGVVGAVVAALGRADDLGLSSGSSPEVGTLGAAAGVFLAVSAVGWYAGGYVAGRMSRFDGGRQGVGVWLLGLVAMLAAAAVGAIFGAKYNVLDRVDLPQLPVSGGEAGLGALVVAGGFLLVTFLAALAGGKMGYRYHRKVDRAHTV